MTNSLKLSDLCLVCIYMWPKPDPLTGLTCCKRQNHWSRSCSRGSPVQPIDQMTLEDTARMVRTLRLGSRRPKRLLWTTARLVKRETSVPDRGAGQSGSEILEGRRGAQLPAAALRLDI